jgi:hypothetical protein
MRLLRTLHLCLFPLVFVASTPALTQTAAPTVRIVEKIDENQLVPLKGNTLPVANAQNDLGPVDANLAMTGLVLVLARSPERQAAFDEFVAGQYDPSSPDFHRWLQPPDVGERFGPSLTDIATLSNWLASRGLSVSAVSKDRMTIRFSGTAAQVQAAFHTEIHHLSVNGEKHIANMSDPQIPMVLAPVVAGVKGLHDFRPKPLHKLGSTVTFSSQTGKWQRASAPSLVMGAGKADSNVSAPHPDFGITVGSGSSASLIEDVAPYDFAAIYNVLPLWNASTPITGTGQTIAIAATTDINLSDVASFRSTFGLPAGLTPVEVKGANGTDPGICTSTSPTAICGINDLTENTLDVEWAGAVAPGAQIVLVASAQSTNNDAVYDSSDYVVENVGVSSSPASNAHILNVSYGLCELGEGTSGNAAYNNLWQTAAAEGIAVFVASGDAGSAACDQGLDNNIPYRAQYGLSVSGLASTPYDTAVGGTDLNWGSTATPYWNSSNSSTTGASAIGYMPEVPWNDTCTNPLALSYLQNSVSPALVKAGFTSATSPTDTESGCQFVLTWYQTVYSTFGVDISFLVDVTGGGGGVSACTSSDGQNASTCTGGYAKPSWQAGVPGIPADTFRDLPDVSFFSSNGFLGSAYVICVSAALPSGVTSCTYPTTITGDLTQIPDEEINAEEVGGTSVASPAMAGVMALINQKAGAPQGNPNAALYALAANQTYASCKTEGGTTGNGCYFNDVDTGTIATPCAPTTPNCAVAHSGDTVAVLPGYGAGVGYDQATGLGSLNVANVVNNWTSTAGSNTATVTLTPSATSITIGQTLTVAVSVTASGATPTGTVTLAGGGYLGGAQALSSGSYTFSIPAVGLAGGSDTLVVSYSGDSNYSPASASTTVTVTKLSPTVAIVLPGPSQGTVYTGDPFFLGVSVGGSSPAPTGTVTITAGSYSSGVQQLSSGNVNITVPPNTLTSGNVTFTAAYSGDMNYATGSATMTVNLTPSVFAISPASAATPASVAKGGSATSTVTATSATDYSGSIALSCALTSGPSNPTGDSPTCAVSPNAVAVKGSGNTATATVTTTAATTGALVRPVFRRNRETLAGLGIASFALLGILGIPRHRRIWHSVLGIFVLLFTLGSLAACGGGGGGSSSGGGSGGGTSNPGTASGTYTFTVTGTGTPAVSPAPTTTFTVTVN